MSAKKNFWLATASALVLFTTAPAMAQNTDANVTIKQADGPAENAGEAIDNAARDAAATAEHAADETAEAAGDAADAAEHAAEETAEAADHAADEAGEAMEHAANESAEAASDAADATAAAANDAAEAMDEATATEVADGTPVEGQIFEQSPDTYLASTLMAATIYNNSDEEVGDVNDMIVTSDGSIKGVVIGVGGFLGVGEKDVAVELSRVEMALDDDGEPYFKADLTEEELEAAPAFMTAEDAEAARMQPATATPATN